MQIHDKNGQVSEPIELHKSTNHKNKFERGQTDEFDVGTCINNNLLEYKAINDRFYSITRRC
jgi:hypothetical protein